MNTDQLELIPQRRDASVDELKNFLRGRGWVKQRDLTRLTGWTDRELRNIAEQDTQGEIITGNNGYKLLRESTVEEILGCADRLGSQAKKMLRRKIRILRAYHAFERSTQTA